MRGVAESIAPGFLRLRLVSSIPVAAAMQLYVCKTKYFVHCGVEKYLWHWRLPETRRDTLDYSIHVDVSE